MSQSLDRGLQALQAIASGRTTLTELSLELNIHKSTAMRLLRTLESHRMVERDGEHTYRLGRGLFALATQALESRDIRQVVQPHLKKLNEESGQTVHLATYESGEVVYIDKFDSMHAVRMYSRVGKVAPLHCTGVGKVLVAALPESERAHIAKTITYTPLTNNTIKNSETYLDVLEKVAKQGYATDIAEHEDFVHCVAAPVRDGTGAVVAAISMSVPVMMLDDQGILKYLPPLLRTARAISATLGA